MVYIIDTVLILILVEYCTVLGCTGTSRMAASATCSRTQWTEVLYSTVL